jgi:hypothetical protein
MVAFLLTIYALFLYTFYYLNQPLWLSIPLVSLGSLGVFSYLYCYLTQKPILRINDFTQEYPVIWLNNESYHVSPNTVLLPNYVMLTLEKQDEKKGWLAYLFRGWARKKQLMIFSDQCTKEEFHALIRLIRFTFEY